MVKKKVSKKERDVNLKNIIVLLVIVLIGLFIWAMVAQGSFDEGEELGAEGGLAQAAPRAGGGGGMIHLWKFEGDLNDSIGRADKKELGNTEIEYVPGVVGLAVKLDYSDSLIALNRYLQDIPNDEFTLDFCMNAAAIKGNGMFIEKKKGNTGFAVRANTSRVSGWAVGRPDDWVDCFKKVVDNQWHHVALTVKKGNNKTIWIDGVKCAENDALGPGLKNNRNFYQGRRLYEGLLDEEAIWDRVLSNSEIAARANICGIVDGSEEDDDLVDGECAKQYTIEGDCATDEFIVRSWTATWMGTPGATNVKTPDYCTDGSEVISC